MYMLWYANLADFLYKGIDTNSERKNDQNKNTDFVQKLKTTISNKAGNELEYIQ